MIADYELSLDPQREEVLARTHCFIRKAILGVPTGLDVESYLRMGGPSADGLAPVRHELMDA